MRFHPVGLPPGDPLWARTLAADPALAEHLPLAALREDGLPPTPRPLEPPVAEAVRSSVAIAGCDDRALERARLLETGAWVVAAGHQPGFLGGPLLVLAKAWTLVALARRLERSTGRAVVPLFWIASEDHDLSEMAGGLVPDPQGGFRRARAPVLDWKRAASTLPVDEAIQQAFDEALAPWGERAREWADIARPRRGEPWPDAFLRLLALATRGTGLVPFDPRFVPPDGRSLLLEAHRRAAEHRHALRRAADRLRVSGLEPVLPLDRESPVFVDDGQRRRRLRRGETADPAALSADASLRPVLEATWFPLAAHVGGPGEVRYWVQLREVFELYGLEAPAFHPRFSLAFLDPKASRALRALGDDVTARLRAILLRTSRPTPTDLPPEVEEAGRALSEAAERLVRAAASSGPQAERAAHRLRESVERALRRTLERVAREREEAGRVAATRESRIREILLPGGRPQERVVTLVAPYLWWGTSALSLSGAELPEKNGALFVIDPAASEPPRNEA